MNAGQLAALIAAGFFAVLACVGIVVLVKLARLMSAVTGIVTEYRERADLLIQQAQEAVDRTNEQLARTDAITASMDQVTANMAELTGHVSALTGLARGLSSAAAAPLHGASAFVFGFRRAVAVRRSLQVAALAETIPATLARPGTVAQTVARAAIVSPPVQSGALPSGSGAVRSGALPAPSEGAASQRASVSGSVDAAGATGVAGRNGANRR